MEREIFLTPRTPPHHIYRLRVLLERRQVLHLAVLADGLDVPDLLSHTHVSISIHSFNLHHPPIHPSSIRFSPISIPAHVNPLPPSPAVLCRAVRSGPSRWDPCCRATPPATEPPSSCRGCRMEQMGVDNGEDGSVVWPSSWPRASESFACAHQSWYDPSTAKFWGSV